VSRKLLILDIVLIAIVAFAGVQWRNAWKASRQREAARLNRPLKPLPPPPVTPLPAPDPVIATRYAKVAQNMLFDPSRNPTVVVEKKPEPPPPPPPPLPTYRGMMNLGDGLVALFRVPGQSGLQSFRVGDAVGPYKLLDINSEAITLEWEGKKFYSGVSQTPDQPSQDKGADLARTAAPAVTAAPPPPALKGPGEDSGRGYRNCTVNDGQAEGAVVDGFRKVLYTTPFGQACRYEPVR
jgi:hypothetical protein